MMHMCHIAISHYLSSENFSSSGKLITKPTFENAGVWFIYRTFIKYYLCRKNIYRDVEIEVEWDHTVCIIGVYEFSVFLKKYKTWVSFMEKKKHRRSKNLPSRLLVLMIFIWSISLFLNLHLYLHMYLNLHLYLSEHSKASLLNFDKLSVVVNRSFALKFIQSFLIVMSFTINKTHQKPPKHVWWLTGYYMLHVKCRHKHHKSSEFVSLV